MLCYPSTARHPTVTSREYNASMLLVIDAGNSYLKFALFDGPTIVKHGRYRNDADVHQALLDAHLTDVDAAVIGSVVPASTPALVDVVRDLFHVDAYVLTSKDPAGIDVDYDPPGTLGIDRFADAAAAAHLAGAPVIAIDMGTATTFNVVSHSLPFRDGAGVGRPKFIGGAIAPGAGVMSEVLSSRAAQLPPVEMSRPPSVIAGNSIHALQSGLFYGYASMVDGMIRRLQAEMGVDSCPVIATGGGATDALIAECPSISLVEPYLTLHGLRLLHEARV